MTEPKIATKYLTFNVGVRYSIALTEAAAQALGKDCDIQEAIQHYFFNTPKDIKLWAESLFLAVNVQREVDGLEQMPIKEFMNICDKMGIKILGEHFALLAKTFTELNGRSDSDIDITSKKKVIIGSRFWSFLNLRARLAGRKKSSLS